MKKQMNVIVVDDEKFAMQNLCDKLEQLDEIDKITGFNSPNEAIEFVKENEIDVAFLDIEMFGMNGIQLAKEIKEARPRVGIIFVSGYPHYALEAFNIHANGYLLKPAAIEAIRKEIAILFEHHGMIKLAGKKIKISTFGNFEAFVEEKIIVFHRNKTKELLAYLVDRRGAAVSIGELIGILWEDKTDDLSSRSQLRTLISDLTGTLKEVNLEDAIIKNRNSIAIDTNMVDCDYYRFLAGDADAVNAYMGEYMTNYSWAEFTAAKLDERA